MISHDLDVIVTESRVVDPNMAFVENITRWVRGGFSFAANVIGGFTTADFNIGCNIDVAWRLLMDHIGRRIILKSPLSPYTGMSVWEGTIYSVTVDDGRFAIQQSLEAVYNRVWIADLTNADPPTIAQDTDSIALYGGRELAINTSAASTEWGAIRSTMLADMKLPRPVQTASRRGTGAGYPDVIVRIQAAGIWEFAGRRLYRSAAPGSQTATAFMLNLLNLYLPGYRSTDYSHVETNTVKRAKKYSSYTPVQNVIGQLCGIGGPTYKRWQFGFYEDGVAYFNEEPTVPAYRISRFDPGERIYDYVTGAEVPPFLIRPGRVIEVSDVMPDSVVYSNKYMGDPRRMVIGEMRYTAPGGLALAPQITNPGQVRLDRFVAAG